MTAYDSDKVVADMLASGATDFGLARFTPAAFDAAGKGLIRAIAAQAPEKRDYEGSQIIASSIGFQKGLRKFDNLADKTVAIDALGSTAHYQLLQIARIKHVDPARITVKALGTLDAIARAVGTDQVDAAIMPSLYARELLMANQAKFLGWYSELDEQQLGALFVSKKMLETRRAVVEKFVQAYRRGAADYAAGYCVKTAARNGFPTSNRRKRRRRSRVTSILTVGMRLLRSSSALITSIHRRDSMSPTSRARSPATSRKARSTRPSMRALSSMRASSSSKFSALANLCPCQPPCVLRR
jgi:NMT1/THI5 like